MESPTNTFKNNKAGWEASITNHVGTRPAHDEDGYEEYYPECYWTGESDVNITLQAEKGCYHLYFKNIRRPEQFEVNFEPIRRMKMPKETADLLETQKAWDKLLGQILLVEVALSKQRKVIEETTETIKGATVGIQVAERLKHNPAVDLSS